MRRVSYFIRASAPSCLLRGLSFCTPSPLSSFAMTATDDPGPLAVAAVCCLLGPLPSLEAEELAVRGRRWPVYVCAWKDCISKCHADIFCVLKMNIIQVEVLQ